MKYNSIRLMWAAYSVIGDAFVKKEPRTLFMKSKNGQLIKDSQNILQIEKKIVNCCGMSGCVI